MTFNKEIYDEYCQRGLCEGIGEESGSVCIEAAFSLAAGFGFTDQPACVDGELNGLLMNMNDSVWYNNAERSKGLYKVGLAQLGTVKIDTYELRVAVTNKQVERIVPKVLKAVTHSYPESVSSVLINTISEHIRLEDFEEAIDFIAKSNLPKHNKSSLVDFVSVLGDVEYDLENAMSVMLYYKHIMAQNGDGLTHEQVMRELSDIVIQSLIELGHTNELEEYWK